MTDLLAVVEDLSALIAPLVAANVERLEVDGAGHVLVEGATFALLLGRREGRPPVSLFLAGGGQALPELAAPAIAEPAAPKAAPRRLATPKARTDARAAELVEERRARPASTSGHASTVKAPHGGRHLFRAGHCEKDGCRACEKCSAQAWNQGATDEYHEPDPHCIACGARPTRQPTPEESDPAVVNGKQRRREPSHNGAKL